MRLEDALGQASSSGRKPGLHQVECDSLQHRHGTVRNTASATRGKPATPHASSSADTSAASLQTLRGLRKTASFDTSRKTSTEKPKMLLHLLLENHTQQADLLQLPHDVDRTVPTAFEVNKLYRA